MRRVWLTSSLSRKAGGLYYSVRRLAQSVRELTGQNDQILGLVDEHTNDDLRSWVPLAPKAFEVRGPRGFGYAPRLRSCLFGLNPDILSLHGLWMYPSAAILGWHRVTKRPYIVSPHGMLDRWALNHCGWKKRIASLLYQRATLTYAGCVRALCRSEAESIRTYGCQNPICIVPNGVDLPPDIARPLPSWKDLLPKGSRVLLYVGRLHPKKGLINLLEAWAGLQRLRPPTPWALVIAGWSQCQHEQQLRAAASDMGINDSVLFVGPQFGDEKSNTYAHADAVILPSLSEGLPMAVLEAWAHRLPVLMTPACNLPEGYSTGSAVQVLPEVNSIQRGLRSVFAMPPEQLREYGQRGRRLVEQRFTWQRAAADMHAVCDWLLQRRQMPESVVLSG